MTIQSYVMIRATGDGTDENPFRPREQDIAPYTSLQWSDYTARASGISDGPLFLNEMNTPPRVMIIDATMSNQDAIDMSTNPVLWMLASKRYDSEGELVEDYYDTLYTEQERTKRITQLSNLTDFDWQQINNWWTPDKTHAEVALRMKKYLTTLNEEG